MATMQTVPQTSAPVAAMLGGKNTDTAQISTQAMLVRLSISAWSGKAIDENISRAISEQFNASRDSVESRKLLISRDALRPIRSNISEMRAKHERYTLPWDNDGGRILPNAHYFEYQREMSTLQSEYEHLVETHLISRLNEWIEQARQDQGSLFDARQYPTPEALRGKFKVRIDILPLPTTGDFRVSLPDKERDRLKQEIEDRLTETFRASQRDAYQRIAAVIGNFSERMKVYDENKPNAAPFRDATVTNVRELVELLPGLNVTNDPELAEITAAIQSSIAHLDPDTLRHSTVTREVAASKADEILARVAGYL